MRLIRIITSAWMRLWRAVAFWRRLNYSWRLAWVKADRRPA